MNKETLNYVTGKTEDLIAAPSCSAEAKEAARRWLDAVGTDRESEETKKYIEELEEDIMPIDNLIAFAGSDAGVQYFGAEAAGNIVSHAEEIKAGGGQYCDCPACLAVAAILEKKDDMLK